MQLKIYQQNAIRELLDKSKRLLGYSGSKKLVFKAPTGSGKTIMMAEFLKQLVDDRQINYPLSFIWTAPRQLHTQSRGKLEDYYKTSRAITCSFFEDLDDRKINENEILFFNWESINKEDNIYVRNNERDDNLSNVLERTKDEGREIILIIDECHHHATSDISKNLIRDIAPKMTIEVSATPVVENPDDTVTVQLEDVKAEGMIKKAIMLNEQFINIIKQGKIKSELSSSSEELVIDIALKKRNDLLRAYKKEEADINPLVLIQLPDRIGQLEDRMKERVISILKEKYKISIENEKLAIWLSGEHLNKENVERPDSNVEVLIFKQAIALGWDCPRAQILVLFREWHTPIFSIQTVGRIMRMSEPENGYYKTDILNYGYVYTNLDNIIIQEDIARDYITLYTSYRKSNYKTIDLLSYYLERHREKTRLSPLFIELFMKSAKAYKLKSKVDPKRKKVDMKIFSDWKTEDMDILVGKTIIGDKSLEAKGLDLQRLFEYFVRKYLSPFYPDDRSVGRVKESIYRFFNEELKMDYGENQEEIVKIVLGDKNIQCFINIIDITKEEYLKEVSRRALEIRPKENWNIPESLTFNANYSQEDKSRSIMKPFFSNSNWKTEKYFIETLEKSNKIDWWFKNGDRDATFFAVSYTEEEEKPFYIDFIVKYKNGKIGLFDTKTGFTQQLAGPKIDGLFKYIETENKKGKDIFGGIVTNTDPLKYNGRWIYFDKTSEHLKNNHFSNWITLEL